MIRQAARFSAGGDDTTSMAWHDPRRATPLIRPDTRTDTKDRDTKAPGGKSVIALAPSGPCEAAYQHGHGQMSTTLCSLCGEQIAW